MTSIEKDTKDKKDVKPEIKEYTCKPCELLKVQSQLCNAMPVKCILCQAEFAAVKDVLDDCVDRVVNAFDSLC